jgi:hypothetical protein
VDAASTAADAISTAADAVSTDSDASASAASAAAALASEQAAAASEAAAAASATYTPYGTGAVDRTVTSRLRESVWLSDYGNGNDAAALQLAIDAVQGGKGIVYIPGNTTVNLGATSVTITGSVRLVGVSNRIRNNITWSSTSLVAIAVASSAEVEFENLTFTGPASCVAGAAIKLEGSGGNANNRSIIKDCTFTNGHRQIWAPDAYNYTISGCQFSAAVLNAIYVGNTTDVDGGDSVITGCTFANAVAGCQYIYQVSGGGLRITNNKLNGADYAYYMQLAAGAVTSILLFQNNSIENCLISGMEMYNSAGTGTFAHAMIQGNEFALMPKAINIIPGAAGFLALLTITGNSISANTSSPALITVANVTRVLITNNNLFGDSAVVGITLGSGVTSSKIDNNLIAGCGIDVADASSNTIASTAALLVPVGKDAVQISGTTSITSINSGNVQRGRTIQLSFADVVTVVNGSNLRLAGASNFTSAALDTLTLTSTDGSYWYETARGAAVPASTSTNALESATTTVNVSSATAPSANQVLTATSSTAATWQTPAAGVSLAGTNTWTGAQTFTNSLMKLLGSSTGATTFASGNTSASNYTVTFPAETFEVGFRNIPQNSQSAAYTLVLEDAGNHIFHPSADTTARIWTIPANASVAYPVGTAITFVNQNAGGVITISITTDTMRLAVDGTTGSRTLAANGVATAVKVTTTEWIISGSGLT